VVAAHSDGLGRGSTFTVRLPALVSEVVPPPVAAPDEAPVEPAGALAGATLLVVDDEDDSRELLVAILEHEGAVVASASSASIAIERLREQRPDVIVCDIGMPVMDGYGFIREVRAAGESGGGWVPAIALTGYASERDSRDALLAGFQMHMGKPVDPARLVRSIARLWRRAGKDEAST
jgi:CheY-like chemotaxis protein